MPTYDMSCGNCDYEGEHRYASWTDAIDAKCPECKKGKLEKQISGFNTNSPSSQSSSSEVPEGEFIAIPLIPILMPVRDTERTEKFNRAAINDSSLN